MRRHGFLTKKTTFALFWSFVKLFRNFRLTSNFYFFDFCDFSWKKCARASETKAFCGIRGQGKSALAGTNGHSEVRHPESPEIKKWEGGPRYREGPPWGLTISSSMFHHFIIAAIEFHPLYFIISSSIFHHFILYISSSQHCSKRISSFIFLTASVCASSCRVQRVLALACSLATHYNWSYIIQSTP